MSHGHWHMDMPWHPPIHPPVMGKVTPCCLVVSSGLQRLREYTLTETLEWSPTDRWWAKLTANFWQLLHPGSSPAVSTTSCYWIPEDLGWESEVKPVHTFLHLNEIHMHITSVMPIKSCGDGKVAKTASVRLHSYCSHQPAHKAAQGW